MTRCIKAWLLRSWFWGQDVDGRVSRDEVRQRASTMAELPALLAELGVDPAEVFAGTDV
jgi:hypothetical protein